MSWWPPPWSRWGSTCPTPRPWSSTTPNASAWPSCTSCAGASAAGEHASRCWLLCDRYLAEESYARIRFFAEHTDGFALAEEDLRLRGPGDAWGVRQSGAPGFRLANPLRDADTVALCREDARRLLEEDPGLRSNRGRQVQEGLTLLFGNFMPPQAG